MKGFPPHVPQLTMGFCAYCHLQLAPKMQEKLGGVIAVSDGNVKVSLVCYDSPDGEHHATRE